MGLIDRALGTGRGARSIGAAVEGVAEVFVPHATRSMELDAGIHRATLETAAAEFQYSGLSRFDRAINGLNRLPRPMLALGTIGLFVYAMVDPAGFAARMAGLQAVPEPLWWLLGAIVSFYFGARELHYFRGRRGSGPSGERRLVAPWHRAEDAGDGAAPSTVPGDDPVADNPALSAWRAAEDGRD